ncbi:uncharacterized protein LOC126373068 [Pectinophora gossypiella]|uniref:uncharacterized protein LOC126373068 n=1 Tax=Pectinophora gossypiella TaxID=13191 RepID=UPI00214E2B6E|nr:uncharacterized protein LOC126373068 [Pectinophora gossypiella]
MGITWRAMPLLSTLAALVIIVHSAEEGMDRDLDREYRYDLRPRVLDPGRPNNDEPWRAIEAEPMMQQSTQVDSFWQDSPEEPIKRRRPVRKRKRRPVAADEVSSDEKAFNPDALERDHLYPVATEVKGIEDPIRFRETQEPLRYRETDYEPEQTTEMPRRRRKKPKHRRNRWAEEYLDIDRPLRRRGQRRKRPSVENDESHWPKLSEFDGSRQDNEPKEVDLEPIEDGRKSHFTVDFDTGTINEAGREHFNNRAYAHPKTENRETDKMVQEDSYEETGQNKFVRRPPFNFQGDTKAVKEYSDDTNQDRKLYDDTRQVDYVNPEVPKAEADYVSLPRDNYQVKEDKPLSEFSLEMIPPVQVKPTKATDEITRTTKIEEKIPGLKQKNKIWDDRPTDAVSLKEILKRSNGSNLIEKLQQHNLSLSDLLRGKEDAISILKLDESPEQEPLVDNKENYENIEVNQEQKDVPAVINSLTINANSEPAQNTESSVEKRDDIESQSSGKETNPTKEEVKENVPKIVPKRRFQGARRKLRMRPAVNGTYKGQLNRDLMAQTARRYHFSRNATKSKEWKNVLSLMNTNETKDELYEKEITEDPSTTTSLPDETTILTNAEYYNPSTILIPLDTESDINNKNENDEIVKETTQIPITTTQETTTLEITSTTDKPKVSRLRPAASRMGLRRQAFNNRLKRKRLKQKNSTTAPPVENEDIVMDLFGMPNLVSSSEFIAKTQTPKATTIARNPEEDFTTLDDFMTTEKSKHTESGPRYTRNSTTSYTTSTTRGMPTIPRYSSTTEETAKFEIEEILNDTRTSARLSRILMERNMTLNELVEHRERGSSHVHLADIFHNASKEPNPPEPFLSKSSIEPISKETYPLRAILEANLHDAAAKATTIDPNSAQGSFVNIPVVMDFGNNVNENGENMGIMSLFNKFTGDISDVEKSAIGKDSEGTPYVTQVIAVNHTDSTETVRESRVLKDEENNLKHDVVGWSELFELMRRNQNETDDFLTPEEDPSGSISNKLLFEDSDGDGVIVLEDLQRLKDFDSNAASTSDEKLEMNTYERAEAPIQPGILDRAPSNTRSVTVATASIVGLAMVLFLLTYAAFKWKQQRNLLNKKQSFSDERIPTPVFENRKGHKNNCSTRSISPMLASSNIYTMNTLDSNATGKESPDYMWDSLRKPFQ